MWACRVSYHTRRMIQWIRQIESHLRRSRAQYTDLLHGWVVFACRRPLLVQFGSRDWWANIKKRLRGALCHDQVMTLERLIEVKE
eukprot:7579304-Pyramimonas_sp.AAC.2